MNDSLVTEALANDSLANDSLANDSLAIVVNVHNCHRKMELLTTRLLEIAAELTSELELVIVDDASDDGSEEIIWQLATRYAQVDHVRHPTRRDFRESARTGLRFTKGRYLLVCDGTRLLDVERIGRLWRDRDDSHVDLNREQFIVVPPPRHNVPARKWLRHVAHQNQVSAAAASAQSQPAMYLLERTQLAKQLGESSPQAEKDLRETAKTNGVVRPSPRRPFVLRKSGDFSPAGEKQDSPSRVFRDALHRLQKSVRSK